MKVVEGRGYERGRGKRIWEGLREEDMRWVEGGEYERGCGRGITTQYTFRIFKRGRVLWIEQ